MIASLKDSYNLDTKNEKVSSIRNSKIEKLEKNDKLVQSSHQDNANYEDKIQKEIQDWNENKREKSLEEHHDFLIEKSEKLKGYLDDYISTLKKSKLNQLKKDEERKEQEKFLKQTIEEVFIREKQKMGKDIAN